MEVDARTFANVTVIAPRGRIDHQSADAFALALAPHLDRCEGETCKLVLDLSGVDYMSSVGLRVLMMAAKQCRAQGGTIVVSGLGETLSEIFQISRFDRVLTVYADVREALGSVAPASLADYDRDPSAGSGAAGGSC
jgi:anti-sigma B factor antagonist